MFTSRRFPFAVNTVRPEASVITMAFNCSAISPVRICSMPVVGLGNTTSPFAGSSLLPVSAATGSLAFAVVTQVVGLNDMALNAPVPLMVLVNPGLSITADASRVSKAELWLTAAASVIVPQ